MALTTANLVGEWVAKYAATSSTAGHNDGTPTSTWRDNVGSNNITLRNTGGNFAWTTTSGWAGAGTAGDPYRLVADGSGDYGTFASCPSPFATDHDFSFEIWTLKTTAVTATTQFFTNIGTNAGFNYYIDATADNGNWAFGTGSTYYYTDDEAAGYGSTPQHHVLTYDAATNALLTYRDTSVTEGPITTTFGPNNVAPMLFNDSAQDAGASIIAIRVYSTVLSSTNISDNYNAGSTAASTDVAPTVTTTAVSNITSTTATSGGTITSEGSSAVTDYGVCWNTTGTPTIADSHTHDMP